MISRSKSLIVFVVVLILLYVGSKSPSNSYQTIPATTKTPLPEGNTNAKFQWASVSQQFPVPSTKSLPTDISKSIPRIQYDFKAETAAEKSVRRLRLELVKGNFTHAWKGYKDHSWLQDEVMPLSGGSLNPFGGWAATLVDSLGS